MAESFPVQLRTQSDVRQYRVISGRMTQTAAAEIFGVTPTSVCIWVNAYKRMGEAGLASKRKGRPSGGKLSKEQEASIRKSVLGKNPGQLRLPGQNKARTHWQTARLSAFKTTPSREG